MSRRDFSNFNPKYTDYWEKIQFVQPSTPVMLKLLESSQMEMWPIEQIEYTIKQCLKLDDANVHDRLFTELSSVNGHRFNN